MTNDQGQNGPVGSLATMDFAPVPLGACSLTIKNEPKVWQTKIPLCQKPQRRAKVTSETFWHTRSPAYIVGGELNPGAEN